MSDAEGSDHVFPSTTWAYRRVIIRPAPQADRTVGRKAGRWWGIRRVDRAHKLRLEVTYRGGPQCWYLIEARGRHGAFDGGRALHDVIREICQQE